MIIEPKVRGFICTTAHPIGCKAYVNQQITYVKDHTNTTQEKSNKPSKVLVIGASTGYGLASRITMAYAYQAATLGVMFEKEAAGVRTATAGWYNTAAFEEAAHKDGLYATTINGDAFSKEVKEQTIERIKKDLGKVDTVIYSLAAPRRTLADGTTYSSVLKTTGSNFESKSLDLRHNTITQACIPAATQDEVDATIKVMGGEDWSEWIAALVDADVLAKNATTIAYSYIGPELTYPIYKDGSIGQAKKHLHSTANTLTKMYKHIGLRALISVNKALVTQASSAIPIVPLYISLLYKVQKELGTHEGCIEQMVRLYETKLYTNSEDISTDGMIRLDDYELDATVQNKISELWEQITTDNLKDLSDIDGYYKDFYSMFGFGLDDVDYSLDIDPNVAIPSILQFQ